MRFFAAALAVCRPTDGPSRPAFVVQKNASRKKAESTFILHVNDMTNRQHSIFIRCIMGPRAHFAICAAATAVAVAMRAMYACTMTVLSLFATQNRDSTPK